MVKGLEKLKNKNRFGTPPKEEEASKNLTAPETIHNLYSEQRIDGRSLRRSGRNIQFATRVSEKFDRDLRFLAQREKLLLVEILEIALEDYKNKLAKS